MFNKVKALIWLRTQMLWSNKNLLIQIAFPYALALLYKEFMALDDAGNIAILSVCLAMSFAFSIGNIVSNIISEEKEKNNLRTLTMVGITSYEYVISTLFYPIILGIGTIILFPKIMDAKINEFSVYFTISFLTALAIVLMNLLVALVSGTQSKAQVNSLPIALLVSFLPMFSDLNQTVANLNTYSFMGAYTYFWKNFEHFSWQNQSFYILLVWIVLLLGLNLLLFRKKPISRKLPQVNIKTF